MFPKPNKSLNSFLLNEEGKIPKESIIKIGAIASFAAAASAGVAAADSYSYYDHSDSISMDIKKSAMKATATHNHSPVHNNWNSYSDTGGGGTT